MIDQKMTEGLEDAEIIDQILTGGTQSIKRKDFEKLEQDKENELIKEMLSKGKKPFSIGDS